MYFNYMQTIIIVLILN